MGREYFGCIVGKYWVAVQSSYCMENYGGKSLGSEATYQCCGCTLENENGDAYMFEQKDDSCFGLPDKIYCKDCYDSYEEHLTECQEENCNDEDITYYVDQTCNWSMNQDDFEEFAEPFIKKHRCLWERFVVEFEVNEDFEYDVTFKGEIDKEYIYIIADLCMLKQIKLYFKETGDYECAWNGEC